MPTILLACLALTLRAYAREPAEDAVDPVVNAAVLAIFGPVDATLKDGTLSEDTLRAVAQLVAPRHPAGVNALGSANRRERLTGSYHAGMVFDPHFGGYRYRRDTTNLTKVTMDGLEVTGALLKEDAFAVLRRNMAQIRYCYQREWTKQPDLAGTVTVQFTAGTDGSVESVGSRAEAPMEVVARCLEGRFLRLEFPARGGAGAVRFQFAPE